MFVSVPATHFYFFKCCSMLLLVVLVLMECTWPWDIIPFVSQYLGLMRYFSIIIHICLICFILENDVENAPKTPESY